MSTIEERRVDYIVSRIAVEIAITVDTMPALAQETLGQANRLDVSVEDVLQRATLLAGFDVRPYLTKGPRP